MYNNIGIAYRDFKKDNETAVKYLEKAYNILESIFGEDFSPLRN